MFQASSNFSPDASSLQSAALQKISALMTRFHSVILPKAKDTELYRDLTDDQQHLLTNMDSEGPLHSILAACLAIDSCLASVAQNERNLTEGLLKGIMGVIEGISRARLVALDPGENVSGCGSPGNQVWKQVHRVCKKLMMTCRGLPYGESHELMIKIEKMLVDESITLKDEQFKGILENKEGNPAIQTAGAHKNAAQSDDIGKKQSLTTKQNEQQGKTQPYRKYSQADRGIIAQKNVWPQLASPLSSSTAQDKQIFDLKQHIAALEKENSKLKQILDREKKKHIKQIRILQQQLRHAQENPDGYLVNLLQELEQQVQMLKEERRHDEIIISSIQQKLEGMALSRHSRITRGPRQRQSRIGGLKYSTMFIDRNDLVDVRNDGDVQSPSFREPRRKRLYTNLDDISRSSISVPKTQRSYQRRKFAWKQETVFNNNDFKRQRIYPVDNPQAQRGLKHSQTIGNFQRPTTQFLQVPHPMKLANKSNKQVRPEDFNGIPMAQSKTVNETFSKLEPSRVSPYDSNRNNFVIEGRTDRKVVFTTEKQGQSSKNEVIFIRKNGVKLENNLAHENLKNGSRFRNAKS